MQIKITALTLLKRYPVQATELPMVDKQPRNAGDVIEINWFRVEGNHLLFEATAPIDNRFNWYAFSGHCEVFDKGKKIFPAERSTANDSIYLKVPFWTQVDNLHEAERTCNTSSCAMAAKFLGAKINSDDEYYKIVRKYGDTTDHGAQTKALKEIGIRSEWCTDLSFTSLDYSLARAKPIVIGILHRGPLSEPRGGHMVVVIGRTKSLDYLVNDPYGSLNDGYTGAVENGRGAVYSRKVLEARWLVENPKTNCGWGRLFL